MNVPINVSRSQTPAETWSLRRQFVVPLGLLILGVALAISLLTAWVIKRTEYAEIMHRLGEVYEQLATTNYPLTPSVIAQIHAYSGVDMILIAHGGLPAASSLLAEETQAAWAHDALHPDVDHGNPPPLVRLSEPPFFVPASAKFFSFGQSRRAAELRGVVLLLSDRARDDQLAALAWAPALSGILSVLVMMLVSSWIASRLARRIEMLEAHVERLSHGTYDGIQLPGPRDVVHRLSLRVNQLSADLKIAHEVIAKTERARLISMVASGMAHDIRNSIAGASLLLETHLHVNPSVTNEEVQMALDELRKVSNSVRSLLASDPGTEMIDEPELPLSQIQTSLREMVGKYAEHQGVRFHLSGDNHDQHVPQGVAVASALVNLSMNAIEAAGAGGEVDVRTTVHRQSGDGRTEVAWQVWDTGDGPPPSIAGSLMEPFVSSKPEGVGLGLAMAKRVAQRCDGSLRWFREGERTCFELRVPAVADNAHVERRT